MIIGISSFILFSGTLITKKFLCLLINKASTLNRPFDSEQKESNNIELNAMFKLSLKHITVAGSERQNVRLAAQLLSHTTATNLRRHFGDYTEAVLLAEIIDVIDKWFDIMNSHQIYQSVGFKKCYGQSLKEQDDALDDMVALMNEIRTLSKHSLPAANHLQVIIDNVGTMKQL